MDTAKGFQFGLRAKTVVIFLVFTTLISTLVASSLFVVAQRQLLEELKSKVRATVQLGADSLDTNSLAHLVSQIHRDLEPEVISMLEDSEDYRVLSAQLNKIRSTDPQVIRFAYLFVATDDPNSALFAADADVLALRAKILAGEDIEETELSHLGSPFDITEFATARKVLETKLPDIDTEFVHDEVFNVNSISGYAPIFDRQGVLLAVLGIDMVDIDVQQALSQVTLLSALITASALLLSLLLSFLVGALLTRNIVALRQTVERFGEQDFAARAEVRSRDEIGALGRSFNAMAQTIVDYQGRMAQAERESVRNAENAKYLNNISQGLLLMDPDRIISGQYSRFLVQLFHLEDSPEGMDFLDFVYPDVEGSAHDREELFGFLTILKENINADQDMLDTINPFKDKELTVRDGVVIVVDAHFLRIGDADHVESIMVVFEDKTFLKETEQQREAERERYDAELESVAAILRNGPQIFGDFLNEGFTLVGEIKAESDTAADTPRMAHFLRQFHSLKGSARAFGLLKIAEEAHSIEDLLGKKDKASSLQLSVELLENDLHTVRETVERFQTMAQNSSGNAAKTELTVFVDSLTTMTKDLSAQLEKQVVFVPQIEVKDIPFLKGLKNPIIHLIRNALDHGIEDQYQRVAARKPETAQVHLEIRRNGSVLSVVVRDDGAGIDFGSIKRSAIRKGILAADAKVSSEDLVKIMFQAGFSSREAVTDISGRGVGLDTISAAVKDLRGKVRVKTVKGKGTAFTMTFPLGRSTD